MDGVTATQKLRSECPNLCPVVGLSANALQGDKEKFLKLGMDDYLTKPVRGEDFVRIINQVI